ncbi:MAG: hypothetical protein R3E97_22145 [Candidatus Eisenbacteria bacterium]
MTDDLNDKRNDGQVDPDPIHEMDALLRDYAAHRKSLGLPLVSEASASSGRPMAGIVGSLVLASLVLFIVLGYRIEVTRRSNDAIASAENVAIAAERLDPSTIEGLDDKGQRIWIQGFDGKVREPQVIRGPGGRVELVAASVLENGTSSRLLALDPTSGKPRWSQVAGFAESGVSDGPFLYVDVSWSGWNETLLATVHAGSWYLSGTQLLDAESGAVQGVYYHPGHLHHGPTLDLDGDGTPSIVLFGDNSSARFDSEFVPFPTERHCGAVVLLDPNQFSGQAYPYSEIPSRPDWTKEPRATERAYLCIAPIDESTDANVLRVTVAPPDGPRPGVVEARLADGRIVLMDQELRPYSVYSILDYPAEVMERDGALESRFVYIVGGREQMLFSPIAPLAELPDDRPPRPDGWVGRESTRANSPASSRRIENHNFLA